MARRAVFLHLDEVPPRGGLDPARVDPGPQLRPAEHAHGPDHPVHGDQPAARRVDAAVVLPGDSPRADRGSRDRRCGPQGPADLDHPADGRPRHRSHRLAVRDLRLERVLLRRSAEPGRRVDGADLGHDEHQHARRLPGQAVGRFGAGLHPRRPRWMARPEANDPWPGHGRNQVRSLRMASVSYEHATRTYEGTDIAAVDDLNLDVGDGELLVLVGPSGSGKSTALRMLAGLEPLNAGAIQIGDRDVSNVRPRDRDIAMVFQNYALYPQLSVAENMGFALKQRGMAKEERRKHVLEAARVLDLEPFLDRK